VCRYLDPHPPANPGQYSDYLDVYPRPYEPAQLYDELVFPERPGGGGVRPNPIYGTSDRHAVTPDEILASEAGVVANNPAYGLPGQVTGDEAEPHSGGSQGSARHYAL